MKRNAKELKRLGIKRSLENADKKNEYWSFSARCLLNRFLAERRGKPFLIEEARAYATRKRLPEPPSLRSWGGVVLKAAKDGLIRKVGTKETMNPLAHNAIANLWVKI
ncbi:hypothetical protein EKI60_06610 [Candidatus Saccharibacteria bacterium]|nr:MAG: hypothetical protein EKI60_06610 [Candidatus Saccharibacteria bacterium]